MSSKNKLIQLMASFTDSAFFSASTIVYVTSSHVRVMNIVAAIAGKSGNRKVEIKGSYTHDEIRLNHVRGYTETGKSDVVLVVDLPGDEISSHTLHSDIVRDSQLLAELLDRHSSDKKHKVAKIIGKSDHNKTDVRLFALDAAFQKIACYPLFLRSELAVQAVVPVALLFELLLQDLGLKKSALLVVVPGDGQFRHLFFDKGALVFTRVVSHAIAGYGMQIKEIEKTIDYIDSTQSVATATATADAAADATWKPLEIVIAANPLLEEKLSNQRLAAFQSFLDQSAHSPRCGRLDELCLFHKTPKNCRILRFLSVIAMQGGPATRYPVRLSTGINCLSPDMKTQKYSQQWARLRLLGLQYFSIFACAVGLAGLVLSLVQFAEFKQTSRLAHYQGTELIRLQHSVDAHDIDAYRMRDTVAVVEALQSIFSNPVDMLKNLSESLTLVHDIEMDQLRWGVASARKELFADQINIESRRSAPFDGDLHWIQQTVDEIGTKFTARETLKLVNATASESEVFEILLTAHVSGRYQSVLEVHSQYVNFAKILEDVSGFGYSKIVQSPFDDTGHSARYAVAEDQPVAERIPDRENKKKLFKILLVTKS